MNRIANVEPLGCCLLRLRSWTGDVCNRRSFRRVGHGSSCYRCIVRYRLSVRATNPSSIRQLGACKYHHLLEESDVSSGPRSLLKLHTHGHTLDILYFCSIDGYIPEEKGHNISTLPNISGSCNRDYPSSHTRQIQYSRSSAPSTCTVAPMFPTSLPDVVVGASNRISESGILES
ncbi:hypothetical protein BC629DRAFT_911980 [Irpex lacteus]|nr:hypothetical protein BC629DRAFT_911980 [Irpex lacteus]